MAVTRHQLDVLETYAATGSYKITAHQLGIGIETVRTTLARARRGYGTPTTIQAYRAALRAGDIRPTVVRVAASG